MSTPFFSLKGHFVLLSRKKTKKGRSLFCEGPSFMKALFFMLLDLENCLNWLNCFEAIPQISSLANQHFYQFPLTCIAAVPHFGVGHSGMAGAQLPGSITWKVCVHPGVALSVTVIVKVAPPPAVPVPNVNCVTP